MLVLEKEIFPRFHIGESLLPIDLPIFERLGVELDYKDFIRKDGAEFIDERTGATATFVFRRAWTARPRARTRSSARASITSAASRPRRAAPRSRYGVRVEDMTVEDDAVRVDTKEPARSGRAT